MQVLHAYGSGTPGQYCQVIVFHHELNIMKSLNLYIMLVDNWKENSSVCRYYAKAASQGIVIISAYKSDCLQV